MSQHLISILFSNLVYELEWQSLWPKYEFSPVPNVLWPESQKKSFRPLPFSKMSWFIFIFAHPTSFRLDIEIMLKISKTYRAMTPDQTATRCTTIPNIRNIFIALNHYASLDSLVVSLIHSKISTSNYIHSIARQRFKVWNFVSLNETKQQNINIIQKFKWQRHKMICRKIQYSYLYSPSHVKVAAFSCLCSLNDSD